MSQPVKTNGQVRAMDSPGKMCSNDTILAVSTPAGASRRAIIRLSGPESLGAIRTVFRPDACRGIEGLESYVVMPGRLMVDGFPRDMWALLYVMRAPRSYTRQDVVELHVPGSLPLAEAIVESLMEVGVRLAGPGEFTRRAYLAGRLDLTQVEAVLKIVNSASEEEMRRALMELEGRFSRQLARARDRLFELLVQLEAALDFSEQGIELVSTEQAGKVLGEIEEDLRWLKETTEGEYVFRDRPRVLLAGRPNTGKSSLFNRLVGSGEAIVSDVPGTTRDVLEVDLSLGGTEVTLVDVAGFAEVGQDLAAAAQAKAEREWSKADLVLLVVDGSVGDEDDFVLESGDRPCMVVVNKMDLVGARLKYDIFPVYETLGTYAVSALTGEGCAELIRGIADAVGQGRLERSGRGYVLNLRQKEGLGKAIAATHRAVETIEQGSGYEFTALELREAMDALSGLISPKGFEEVLDEIFAQFCVGK